MGDRAVGRSCREVCIRCELPLYFIFLGLAMWRAFLKAAGVIWASMSRSSRPPAPAPIEVPSETRGMSMSTNVLPNSNDMPIPQQAGAGESTSRASCFSVVAHHPKSIIAPDTSSIDSAISSSGGMVRSRVRVCQARIRTTKGRTGRHCHPIPEIENWLRAYLC